MISSAATPVSLSEENSRTMLPQLANTSAHWGHAIVSRCRRLFRRTGKSAQGVNTQSRLVRATKRVDGYRLTSTGQQESLDHVEFVQTQRQLMETMLKAMILASGWRVDGSAGQNDFKPKR
jgi:hypothetical protein